jgi:hypothetical protein
MNILFALLSFLFWSPKATIHVPALRAHTVERGYLKRIPGKYLARDAKRN